MAFTPDAIDQTALAIVAVPAPGVSVAELEQAINREVTRIHEGAIDEADVQLAQKKMRAHAIRMRDGTLPAAQVVGAALSTGATLDEIDTWPARIGAVTVCGRPCRSESRAQGQGVRDGCPYAEPGVSLCAHRYIFPVALGGAAVAARWR